MGFKRVTLLHKSDFLNHEGVGEVRDHMVYYRGTFWGIDPSIELDLKDGEKVNVLRVENGYVFIEKRKAAKVKSDGSV